MASLVVSAIPGFLAEAEHLYAELKAAGVTRLSLIDLPPGHEELVLGILRPHLPQTTKA